MTEIRMKLSGSFCPVMQTTYLEHQKRCPLACLNVFSHSQPLSAHGEHSGPAEATARRGSGPRGVVPRLHLPLVPGVGPQVTGRGSQSRAGDTAEGAPGAVGGRRYWFGSRAASPLCDGDTLGGGTRGTWVEGLAPSLSWSPCGASLHGARVMEMPGAALPASISFPRKGFVRNVGVSTKTGDGAPGRISEGQTT